MLSETVDFESKAGAFRCGRENPCAYGGQRSQSESLFMGVVLGDNVNFNGMRIVGEGEIRIGSNFHSGRGCSIIGSFHDFDYGDAVPYGMAKIDKDVVIEDNVWLGDQVIVLGGAHIGEGAVIQAGSVVVDHVPKGAVAGGHPAKMFKMRDMDHYEALKAQGRFFWFFDKEQEKRVGSRLITR